MKNHVEQLNSFLRGEIAAVETYRQAIDKVTDASVRLQLEHCRRSHQQRADLLKDRILRVGGAPADGSGVWGAFAKLVEGGAMVFGDKAAIDVLEQGEDHGLKVAIHALSEKTAHRGAVLGADILAHIPTEHLTEETLVTWANRTVITTLSAFGGNGAVENASDFHKLGGKVLYGTDFGNTAVAGISQAEIEQLLAAGFDGAAIVAAGTRVPAAYWGFDHLGEIAVGKAASVLVLAEDPNAKPLTLANPVAVYVGGVLATDP